MEIERKAIFTLIDLAMDHFHMEKNIRERFLIWLSEFYEFSSEDTKKWSKVGKGIDYDTFKYWVSRDNRFLDTKTVLPSREFSLSSHYFSIESIIDQINHNDYEQKLKLYHCLSLLCLVDKKFILTRVKFIQWLADCMDIESSDTQIIRECVVEEFDLHFELKDLDHIEKEHVFLCGVKMAHLSGDILDSLELDFLYNLKSRLNLETNLSDMNYFFHYLEGKLSTNSHHSQLSIHKIGAVLLQIIGSDSNIDKREGKWFKEQLRGLDNHLLSSLMTWNIDKLVASMEEDERALCYILGLEVSLRDRVLHKNEVFWLDSISMSLTKSHTLSRDNALILFEVISSHFSLFEENINYFEKMLSILPDNSWELFAQWRTSRKLLATKANDQVEEQVAKALGFSKCTLDERSKVSLFIDLAFHILGQDGLEEVSLGLSSRIENFVHSKTDGAYGEILICEILKVSFLDHQVEVLEEDFLRDIQYRFSLSDAQLHRVVFLTSFLIGKNIEIGNQIHYSYL